jgi:hypothetical protein
MARPKKKKREASVHFIDPRSGDLITGRLAIISVQPFTGEPICLVEATNGMSYWAPKQLIMDGVLGALARL